MATPELRQQAVFLTWHVDYWDRLGWKDPFAAKAFTERQQRYRTARKQKQMWTPQFVVDGEIVASGKSATIPELVKKADAAAPAVAIEAIAALAKGKVQVGVRLHPTDKKWQPGKDVVVTAVLFRRKVETAVPRGENEGRTLVESFVALATAPVAMSAALGDKGGSATFDLPEGLEAGDVGIAVLVEDTAAMRTLQCAVVDVAEKPAKAAACR